MTYPPPGLPPQGGHHPHGNQTPGVPGMPAYGHPAQPPAPPQHPAPYGTAPYGQQYPQPYPPPPGQPPAKRRTGLLVAVAVAVAAAVTVGLVVALGGDDGGLHDDGRAYTLEPPAAVGTLERDPGGTENMEDVTEGNLHPSVQVDDMTGAMYEDANPPEGPVVGFAMFNGYYGTIGDPQAALDAFFADGGMFTSDGNARFVGEPVAMEPDGLGNAVMTCRMLEGVDVDPEETPRIPVCAWADFDTLGIVVTDRLVDETTGEHPEPVSLEDGARFTADLRAAALVEVQGGEEQGMP
ncbi:hypothetical protein [Streptomyces sp. NPDC049879]|uniref:hypothetical protein n=1 Tax=Streptomyces sp. NPDC049879 TaxID=3365598 RepID=UPI003788F90F